MDKIDKLRLKIDKLRLLKFVVLAKDDPMFFIENYAKVQHPSKGPIPFVVQDFQKEYLDAMVSGKTVMAKGGRQTGMTITALMYVFYYACTHDNREIIISAPKYDQTMDNLSRIIYAYEHLPEALKQGIGVERPNKNLLEFSNGTRIRASATVPCLARGVSVDLIHFDNFANVKTDIQRDVWTSIMPCLCATGAQAIVSSTTAGDGWKFFKELYDNAKDEKSDKVKAVCVTRDYL
jgi:hypothetical protein